MQKNERDNSYIRSVVNSFFFHFSAHDTVHQRQERLHVIEVKNEKRIIPVKL